MTTDYERGWRDGVEAAVEAATVAIRSLAPPPAPAREEPKDASVSARKRAAELMAAFAPDLKGNWRESDPAYWIGFAEGEASREAPPTAPAVEVDEVARLTRERDIYAREARLMRLERDEWQAKHSDAIRCDVCKQPEAATGTTTTLCDACATAPPAPAPVEDATATAHSDPVKCSACGRKLTAAPGNAWTFDGRNLCPSCAAAAPPRESAAPGPADGGECPECGDGLFIGSTTLGTLDLCSRCASLDSDSKEGGKP